MINVIVGPSCAGKSTHVQETKNIGDVVVDYDLLSIAIGSEASHGATDDIRKIAQRARFSAIRGILEGIESNAWIIHTNPQGAILADYMEAGAIFTLLDPGKDVCKERAETRPDPAGTEAAIDAWYDNPPPIPSNSLMALVTDLRLEVGKWLDRTNH